LAAPEEKTNEKDDSGCFGKITKMLMSCDPGEGSSKK
jgi:hypothetical protein